MDTTLERILECMGPGHGAAKALADALHINPQIITNWKCGQSRSYRKYLEPMAAYFHVSVEYLLGKTDEKEKTPAGSGARSVSDEDIRFALFNGADNITDDMFEEVKRFAQFIQERERDTSR